MRRKKKRAVHLFFLLALFLVSIIGVKSVYAYFVYREECQNLFTVGENTIVPEEPFEPPVPGEKTVKEPRAVNCGKVDCYVRAKVLLSDSRVKPYLTYVNDVDTEENLWTENNDGWIYYSKEVETSKKTEPLFTHIVMAEKFPEELKDFSIDVVFESVQSEGFENAEEAFAAIAGTA